MMAAELKERLDLAKVDQIIERYEGTKGTLIAVLQDLQDEYYYLPEEALRRVAERMEVPLSRIYSLARFYKAFSLKPRGKYLISVCLGTACHVRGGQRNLEKLQRDLGIRVGETTPDHRFTLERVYCLGACALAPLVVIGKKYYGRMTPAKLEVALKGYAETKETEKLPRK